MMGEAGYTLAETLTALAIMGLAMSGVASGMYVVSRQQFAVTDGVAQQSRARAIGEQIEALLALRAPFGAHEPDRLSGDRQGFSFQCGEGAPCRVALAEGGEELRIEGPRGAAKEISIPGKGNLAFLYQGARSAGPSWPTGDLVRQPLSSISLVREEGGDEQVLFVARIEAEQPAECQFDPVMQDCR